MPVNWKKGTAELKDKKSSGSNTGESGDDVYLKDGWYRLKIYAEDLAGNQEEQEICFAVNAPVRSLRRMLPCKNF